MPSHQSRRSSVLLAATATAGLFAVLAGGAIAAEQGKNDDVKVEAAPAAQSESGMKVYIDPQTGAFREPSMEERQAEAAPSKASTAAKAKPGESVVPITRARNGTMMAHDTEGATAEYVTVEIGADGKQHFRCTHGLDQHPAAEAAAPAMEEK